MSTTTKVMEALGVLRRVTPAPTRVIADELGMTDEGARVLLRKMQAGAGAAGMQLTHDEETHRWSLVDQWDRKAE